MNSNIHEFFLVRHSRNAKLRQFKIKNSSQIQQIPRTQKTKLKQKFIVDINDIEEEEILLSYIDKTLPSFDFFYYYSGYHIRKQRRKDKEQKKQKEIKRTQRQLLYPMKKIEQFIQRNKNDQIIEISVEDQHQTMILSQFPFHLMNPFCYQMNLELKGFEVDQEGFEIFCSYFPQFIYLNYLKLRVDNKRIQYFDCLFKSITKIKEVNIDLQDFRKIKFKDDFTQPILNIIYFRINLKNATFKTSKDQSYFQNFLVCLKNLTDFRLETKNKQQLQLLQQLPKQTDIYVILSSFEGDIELWDTLIYQKNKYNLNIVEVETPINLLKFYLSLYGFNVKHPFLPEDEDQETSFRVNQFTEQDLKLIDKVPELFDIIEQESSTLKFQFSKRQRCLQLKKTHIKEELILMVQKEIVFPLIPLMDNVSLRSYFGRSQDLNKFEGVWIIPFEYLLCWFIDNRFEQLFSNMVSVSIQNSCFYNRQCCDHNPYFRMKMIEQNNYLISIHLQTGIYDRYCHFYKNNNKYLIQIYLDYCQIINTRGEDKLRFLVFRKYIYDEIPLPKQIFVDLMID